MLTNSNLLSNLDMKADPNSAHTDTGKTFKNVTAMWSRLKYWWSKTEKSGIFQPKEINAAMLFLKLSFGMEEWIKILCIDLM